MAFLVKIPGIFRVSACVLLGCVDVGLCLDSFVAVVSSGFVPFYGYAILLLYKDVSRRCILIGRRAHH